MCYIFRTMIGQWHCIVGVALFTIWNSTISTNAEPPKVVCYLGSWANYRQGNGKFVIEDIDPFLCTHVIYGFAKLDDGVIKPFDPYLDLKENYGLGAYQRFGDLRKKNSNLKTLIAVGGWNEGSTKYSQMASTEESRRKFAYSCLKFVQEHGFDGLDMDWEYPTERGGVKEDKQNFVLLLKALRKMLNPHGYLLTAAVAAGKSKIDSAYDVKEVSRYLDFINLMSYDFHGSWETVTGHNAPLYPPQGASKNEKILTVDFSVNYWISQGAPPEKLILGMGFYGRTFTLQDPNQNGIRAPTTAPGNAGPITQLNGMLGYNEICDMLGSDAQWTYIFDDHMLAPYAYKDNQWVGFDDVKSINLKVDYLKKMNLGGGMVWSLETDDFKGLCGKGRYPLLQAINDRLNGFQPQTPKVTPGTTTRGTATKYTTKQVTGTTGVTPSTKQPDGAVCKREGYFRDPNDCSKFYRCVRNETGGYSISRYNCAPGTAFNERIKSCDHISSVPECQ